MFVDRFSEKSGGRGGVDRDGEKRRQRDQTFVLPDRGQARLRLCDLANTVPLEKAATCSQANLSLFSSFFLSFSSWAPSRGYKETRPFFVSYLLNSTCCHSSPPWRSSPYILHPQVPCMMITPLFTNDCLAIPGTTIQTTPLMPSSGGSQATQLTVATTLP